MTRLKIVRDYSSWRDFTWNREAPGSKLVLTNGIFDVLHPGHVEYLEYAKSFGDILIVALNTDESTRQLKGPTRPINGLEARMRVIAGLQCVNFVVPFEGLRIDGLIKVIQPKVWVKGGDYTLESLDQGEVAAAREVGAEIQIVPAVAGFSTTLTLNRIRA